MNTEPQLWKNRQSRLEADCRIFKILRTTFEHEKRRTSGDFFVMDTADWVHVVALTPDEDMVMVQQFRFGTENLSWEIPGGLIEPDEDPVDAAIRELREETGFVGEEAKVLATIAPNPAIQNNRCHFVLITGAVQVEELEWDEHEEIQTRVVPRAEVEQWALEGKMMHSLSITSLFYLKNHLERNS